MNFDRHIRDALCNIIGVGFGDLPWKQAQLPVSMGGMSLRGASDHALAAFISSVSHAETHFDTDMKSIDITRHVTQLGVKLGLELTRGVLVNLSQKEISLLIDKKNLEELNNATEEIRDKARLNSLSIQHSGDWLNCVPSHALGLHLKDQEFVLMCRYRLGVPVHDSDGVCPACNLGSDAFGDHAISCGSDGERIARHNHLRDAIFAFAVSTSLAPQKEERALIPGRGNKPADVLIPHWSNGLDAALDVTVVNSLRSDYILKEADQAGYALDQAHKRKVAQVGTACQQEGIDFIPLPVEVLGGWSSVAVKHLKRIARAHASRTGRHDSEVVTQFFQKLSILLVKGNAALLLSRLPS